MSNQRQHQIDDYLKNEGSEQLHRKFGLLLKDKEAIDHEQPADRTRTRRQEKVDATKVETKLGIDIVTGHSVEQIEDNEDRNQCKDLGTGRFGCGFKISRGKQQD